MEKLFHAYIILGDPKAARERAEEMAAAFLCEGEGKKPCMSCRQCRKVQSGLHPDVIYVTPPEDSKSKAKRMIGVEQTRDLRINAVVLPNEAKRKVYIFPEADAVSPIAQNTLLKLLEEPPAFDVFLLCTEDREKLLETIRSRCEEIRVGRTETSHSDDALLRAERFLQVRDDRAELLRCCLAMEKLDSQQLQEVIDCIRTRSVRTLTDRREILDLDSFLKKAVHYLRDGNLGVKQVIGYLSTYLYDGK